MSLEPPHHAFAIGSWRVDAAFTEEQPQQRGFSSAGFADYCNQALSALDAVMQAGQRLLMNRAQVKIAGIGCDAEGKFYKPKMVLIHRMVTFGTRSEVDLLAGANLS